MRDQPLLAPLDEADNSLAIGEGNKDLVQLPKSVVTMVPAQEHVKILGFEVFKNYLAVL